MEIALFGALILLLVANAAITSGVLRSSAYDPSQKALQLLLVWLVPVLGAVFVWSFLRGAASDPLTTDLADRNGSSVGFDAQVNLNSDAADVGGFGGSGGGH
jgi:hypothetical protein